MILAVSILLIAGVLAFVLLVRPTDLPPEPPPSPTAHLEERKAVIYENLRDLQFEYRLGKLSDEDYQKTKAGLQNELASIMAEIDRLAPAAPAAAKPSPASGTPRPHRCHYCGTRFDKPMKFCGECGRPLPEVKA
jgi:hypothetical protein